MKNQFGFTLVELLIAISIIGVLTGILVVVINPGQVQRRTRDGIRSSNVSKLSSAVEAYNASEGVYPSSKSDLQPVYIKNSPDGRPQSDDVYNYGQYTDGACVWVDAESKSGCIKYRTSWGEVREEAACDCTDG